MTHHIKRMILPFTAIVGQEKMKKTLIWNAINPKIGGVLIRGEKGTAKSTAVRSLAELLPDIDVVKGCPFNCNPYDEHEMCDICYSKANNNEKLEIVRRKVIVKDLPLGATEDRVVGSLNVEKAIKEGIKALEPGILAAANRGILYIDEVNLLDDYIANILLDAAAMGVNVVEREGVSVAHPAKFILIGTMNPEEGEIRPQLLDRFGLHVEVESIDDVDKRIEIIKTAEDFEDDPISFVSRYEPMQQRLRDKILKAKEILPYVAIDEDLLRTVAETCIKFNVRSHRAEITVVRTAKTIAAFDGRKNVNLDDIKEAMEFALPHRMRNMPFDQPILEKERLEESIDQSKKDKDYDKKKDYDLNADNSSDNSKDNNQTEKNLIPKEECFDIGKSIDPSFLSMNNLKRIKKYTSGHSGKGATSLDQARGRYIGYKIPKGKPCDIAIDATIRAAAPYQKDRRKDLNEDSTNGLIILKEDIRDKVRMKEVSTLSLFVVDASGSMGENKRMESAKGAIFSLLLNSYQKRDKVALIAFRGNDASVLLPPSSGIDKAVRYLQDLPTGGKTPLAAGISKGLDVIKDEKRRKPDIVPMMVLISDGRSNVPFKGDNIKEELIELSGRLNQDGVHLVIIDTETNVNKFSGKLGYNEMIAETSNGIYYKLDDLTPQSVENVVKMELNKII